MTRSEPWVHAAALASLPRMTHRRLRRLIDLGDPVRTWARLVSGDRSIDSIPGEVLGSWRESVDIDLEVIRARCLEHRIRVITRHDRSYPSALSGDPDAPAVVFVRGDIAMLERRRVGIVGTRHATAHGERMARRLGRELASSDVAVVSGLARGIDVQAHLGVFDLEPGRGAPVAVVASGLDHVYPREHRSLWNRIANEGVLISEAPPGTAPSPHRFPLRNRIIAALCEVLVVVESKHRGGSMITAAEAAKRDVTVMAVPGSPQVIQSEGTNALLRDGCAPVTDVTDVLVALGLDNRRVAGWHDPRSTPTVSEQRALEAMGTIPRSVDEMSLMLAMSVVDTALLLGRLEAKGWVRPTDGWWEALVS